MFTINCHARYPETRLDDLHNHISGLARFWLDRAYGEIMIRTAGTQRMKHLDQFLANDGHLTELSRHKRKVMTEPARS